MHNCGLQFIMYPSNDNSDAGLRDFWLFHVGKVGYNLQRKGAFLWPLF